MNAKTQKPNLRLEKIQSASFLLWLISGLYLLTMVWLLLLSPMGGYGSQEVQPWSVSAVVVFTVSYGIFILLLWPHEKASRTELGALQILGHGPGHEMTLDG
jgi:hypothetical protein